METFLSKVASQILAEHPNDLDQITIVFNNRRSGVFLKDQLVKQANKAIFLPTIIGIDDLISDLGNLKIIPNEFLLFELFNIHKKIKNTSEDFKSFEEFISFGDIMISDFSEIDLYCVDAKKIFTNLSDLKNIEQWNPNGTPKSEIQKNYLEFYQSLYSYYENLHKRLEDLGMAYSGMAYRNVAENIDSLINQFKDNECYFIGFNALSECEKTIINKFCACGIGKTITDGDAYYYKNLNQEAGTFLRNHEKIFKQEYDNYLSKAPKKIKIISCPENILQTKYAGQILTDTKSDGIPLEQTAIVLSDEELLIPMLNSLPDEINTVNISMGLPLIKTQIHTLILKLFSLYNRVKFQGFYHQDVLDILADYHIHNLTNNYDLWRKTSDYFSKNNVVYVTTQNLTDLSNTYKFDLSSINYLFENLHPTPNEFLNNIQRLLNQISDLTVPNDNNKSTNIREQMAIGCLYETINYFIDLQNTYDYIQQLSTLQKIYVRVAQRRSISLYGNPISDLQILGVLETRNLDFKKIIMLSVNEGIIPSGKSNNTFIPIQLKIDNNIPTYREKDAVYAYHFYRFLQRADEIYLIYHTESDDNSSKGECSRFILQIKEELANINPNIDIEKINISTNYKYTFKQCPHIGKKSESVMKKLNELADYGFSPSGLNTYRDCPLRFYYDYVLNAKPIDEINDELSSSQLGSLIHKVLEDIYGASINKNIKKEDLLKSKKNIDNNIKKAYQSVFKHEFTEEGTNYLICSIAKEQINNLIDKEINQLNENHIIQIKGVEQKYIANLCITQPEKLPHTSTINKDVKIRGTIDRIDTFDNTVRIIDYKTGVVTDKDLLYPEDNKELPNKLFQIMTYLWLYRKQNSNPSLENFQIGIYPLQDIHKNFIYGHSKKKNPIALKELAKFEVDLKNLIEDIMNPNKDFEPNYDSNICKYCPMNITCHKS